MPRKLPMHVERWKDRHGRWRVYYREGKGKRVPLPDLDAPEFGEAYAAALAGRFAPERPTPTIPKVDTIAGLVASYLKSPAYVELRATTKTGYMSRLEAIRVAHGHRSVSGLTMERIETGILAPYAGQPGARLDTLKKLRILIRHAIRLGWIKHDPSFGIKRPKIAKVRSWTDAEITAFREHWPLGSRQRTAFELFLNTGQRRSDVHRMAWSHIERGKIAVTQQKTGKRLVIPLHPDLVEALERAERNHVAILTTAFGAPFTVDGFGQWFRDAIAKAGLPLDVQPHGLRKAAGRQLAEAGCSARQVMAILGHTTLSEAERYTEEAGQEGLAEQAIRNLTAARNAYKLPKPTQTGLGKIDEKREKSKS